MTELEKALSAIEGQQKNMEEGTAPWMVAEQLKDILRGQPSAAEIVSTDLTEAGLKIRDCERKIEACAKERKKGNCGCCPPKEADRIIREFFGIPAEEKKVPLAFTSGKQEKPRRVSLADFL